MTFRFLACLTITVTAHAETLVSIQPDEIVREVNLSHLLGTNAGLWYAPKQMQQLVSSEDWKRWQPGLIRIPGGSWGDELVWNGNGIRSADGKLDASKFIDGRWQVDYSAYQPSFRAGANGHFSDYHGNVDVKFMHEFIRDAGASAIVTVNAGTGTPEMAAEWVKWAKANNYPVAYWEIGNELEGKWEQGHFRPDGKEMTPEIYADIYRRFATAMKAVDPTIKVGGPTASNDGLVLASAMLEQSPELVDFISYHTYPANSHEGTTKLFTEADSVLTGMKNVRQLIRDKAPQHAERIQVGITEWHVGIHEGPRTVNQISGPWCAKWIGRMIEAGVDFANVWDLFSQTAQGGHGIFGKDEALTPRGPFWALTLWNQHLGGTLVKCETQGPGITAFATKREKAISLLLINENESESATAQISRAGQKLTGSYSAAELSSRSYLWNEHANRPEWSQAPIQSGIGLDAEGRVSLPPLSATVLHLDQPATPKAESIAKAPDVLLPAKQPADVPFTAWITLPGLGSTLQNLQIETTGPLKASAGKITLHSAAAPLVITPTGAGKGEIIVHHGEKVTRRSLELTPVNFRPHVLWAFDKEEKAVTSPHRLDTRDGAAFITLTKTDSNRLIEFNELPPCDKPRIGGITVKLRAESIQAPKEAKLTLVCQSLANHWMALGDIPLSKLTVEASTHELKLPDIHFLEAMHDLRAVLILLQNAPDAKGVIIIDEICALLRH
jgi:hypothetical protein